MRIVFNEYVYCMECMYVGTRTARLVNIRPDEMEDGGSSHQSSLADADIFGHHQNFFCPVTFVFW